MNCEYCGQQHEGTYGSGRFCSPKCSRGFSTRNKRSEINEKVKLKAAIKFPIRFISVLCKNCKKQFETKKKTQKFCCRTCATKHINADPIVQEKIRISRLKEIEKGNVGYGIKTEFEGIRCDSALEYAFLKWYKISHPEAKIERFKGYLEGEGIKYQPDFIIDDKIIVEVKYTTPYIGEKLSEKWKTYLSSQEPKRKILKEHEYLWISEKDIGVRFYRKCISELKKCKV